MKRAYRFLPKPLRRGFIQWLIGALGKPRAGLCRAFRMTQDLKQFAMAAFIRRGGFMKQICFLSGHLPDMFK